MMTDDQKHYDAIYEAVERLSEVLEDAGLTSPAAITLSSKSDWMEFKRLMSEHMGGGAIVLREDVGVALRGVEIDYRG